MRFKSFGFSDPGKVRSSNEDSYLCNEEEGLFFVADGMGGHASGKTASLTAIKSIEKFILKSRSENSRWSVKISNKLSLEQNRLLAAASFGNRVIKKISKYTPSMKGMGTTLIGGVIEGDNLSVINVGDSRLYRIRDKRIEQLTQDHTLAGQQERDGTLTREEARHHPNRNILTCALGYMKDKSNIDTFLIKIKSKDLYLICTDGLYEMLEDDEIFKIIDSTISESLYKAGISLALNANLAGGRDNITFVLLSFN
ncbi:PP2C family protein-serine/threonine phosphatase [Thermodesulfobacteriota bacterium]